MDFLDKKRNKIFVVDSFHAGEGEKNEEGIPVKRVSNNKAKNDFREEIDKLKEIGVYCSGSLLRGKSGKWEVSGSQWANRNQGEPFYTLGKVVGLQDEWKDYEGILVAERNNLDSK